MSYSGPINKFHDLPHGLKYGCAIAADYAYLLTFSMLPPLLIHWLGSVNDPLSKESDMVRMAGITTGINLISKFVAECCYCNDVHVDSGSAMDRLKYGFGVNSALIVLAMFVQPAATHSYSGFLVLSMGAHFCLAIGLTVASITLGGLCYKPALACYECCSKGNDSAAESLLPVSC